MFQFCVSQQINETPYLFKSTGIRVYSFEEVLYHVYHYWKQSVDDFLSEEMIQWVNETLGLSYLAARMKELTHTEPFGKRILSFLRLIDYFNEEELISLNHALTKWELRREWEKYKERADFLMNRGGPEKALPLYRRALQYEENISLLNNTGVACMQLGLYEEALQYLLRACDIEPSNIRLAFNYIEAAIYSRRYHEARETLEAMAATQPASPDIHFFYGMISYEQNDYSQAIVHFEKALEQNRDPAPIYVYKLADVYMNMRRYDKALDTLGRLSNDNIHFYMKQAELHAASGNMPAAVKSVQKAISIENNDVGLWVKLAMYHRLDYNWAMADSAIIKALAIDPENERARLESARIKKGMGKIREYQSILNNILSGFRQRYREV